MQGLRIQRDKYFQLYIDLGDDYPAQKLDVITIDGSKIPAILSWQFGLNTIKTLIIGREPKFLFDACLENWLRIESQNRPQNLLLRLIRLSQC